MSWSIHVKFAATLFWAFALARMPSAIGIGFQRRSTT